MLFTFTFSITPKRYLHDLFTGHKDYVSKSGNDEKIHISQNGFKCDCNTLVATSPFTEHSDEIDITISTEYPSLFVSLTTSLHTSSHSHIELRGPPSVG
jgi:hypothetical protein